MTRRAGTHRRETTRPTTPRTWRNAVARSVHTFTGRLAGQDALGCQD
ncbi:hypothetical protein [Mumia sp. DW29H23]